jgi:Rrf2 family nitric oxide-sensitive transcriptional repressor
MRLTAFTDYSLRVLIWLAADPGHRSTTPEVAEHFGIKENHLTKVIHFLGRAGLIETVRGKGGGFTLAVPAAKIVLGEVVRQTEGDAVPAECFDEAGGHCVIAASCHLKGVLQEAVDAFYLVLDAYTLADLVTNREEIATVLFHPRPPVAAPRREPARGPRPRP